MEILFAVSLSGIKFGLCEYKKVQTGPYPNGKNICWVPGPKKYVSKPELISVDLLQVTHFMVLESYLNAQNG
jgi:hypothetical protein